MSEKIELSAKKEGLSVAGKIEYNEDFTTAQVEGRSLQEYSNNNATKQVTAVWDKVLLTMSKD